MRTQLMAVALAALAAPADAETFYDRACSAVEGVAEQIIELRVKGAPKERLIQAFERMEDGIAAPIVKRWAVKAVDDAYAMSESSAAAAWRTGEFRQRVGTECRTFWEDL